MGREGACPCSDHHRWKYAQAGHGPRSAQISTRLEGSRCRWEDSRDTSSRTGRRCRGRDAHPFHAGLASGFSGRLAISRLKAGHLPADRQCVPPTVALHLGCAIRSTLTGTYVDPKQVLRRYYRRSIAGTPLIHVRPVIDAKQGTPAVPSKPARQIILPPLAELMHRNPPQEPEDSLYDP